MAHAKTKKPFLILVLIMYALAIALMQVAVTNAQTTIHATCVDTIAGYSALCKSSVTVPNSELTVKVTKPDGSVVRFPCTTNVEGVAKCDLNYFHTKQAGLYKAGMYLSGYGEPNDLSETNFRVFADTISAVSSSITLNKQSVGANGVDFAYASVTLQDSYGNAIVQHPVNIISSQLDDKIEAVGSNISNPDGKVNFKISSKTTGVSTLLAQDTFSGVTLTERPKLVFYSAASSIGSTTSSSSLKTDIFGTAVGGPATSFTITAPEQVEINTPFDVTVQVLDSNGNPALAYRGTILFSAPGDQNASLPLQDEGYTFKGTDENASHTFAKATIFSTTGQHKLVVTDVDNPDLEAQKYITAVSKGQVNANINGSSNGSVTITSPSPNSTYGETKVDILGKMAVNTKFKVMDSGLELGGDQSDSDGNFLFTARGLADGKHSFSVIALDANDAPVGQSDEVIVFIDTKAATLQSITFTPGDAVAAGTPLQVSVVTEPKLTRARLIVDGVAHDLTEDTTTPGTYRGTFTAPTKEGQYPVQLVLINTLGKESDPATNKTLTVTKPAGVLVTGLKTSTGASSGSMDLTWDDLADPSNFQQYVIYYDTNPLTLGNKAFSSEATSSFTVTGLQKNTTYYFAVAVKDGTGKEGNKSDIIPGTTKDSGNGISNVQAVGDDGRVILSWDDPGNTDIVRYKIEYGIHSGEYVESALTKDDKTTWYIPDLINGLTYYFKVSGLDSAGQVVLASEEVIGTAGKDAHPAAGPCVSDEVNNLRIVADGNGQMLTWDSLPGVNSYLVYSGVQEGVFNLPTREVTDNSYALPSLNKQYAAYYFAVRASCSGQHPAAPDFSNALKVAVGTESWMVVAVSLMFIGGVYMMVRRKKAIV